MPTAWSQLLTKRSLHGRVLEVCVDLDIAIRMDEIGDAKTAAQRCDDAAEFEIQGG